MQCIIPFSAGKSLRTFDDILPYCRCPALSVCAPPIERPIAISSAGVFPLIRINVLVPSAGLW